MSKKSREPDAFDRLVAFLRGAGFEVEVTTAPQYVQDKTTAEPKLVQRPRRHDYRYATVTGKNIRACFAEPNETSYRVINGQIAADNDGCWSKWTLCPLILPFPADGDQEAKLLVLLAHLGSAEGLAMSDGMDYPDGNPYHY